jgi:hypothetical protein
MLRSNSTQCLRLNPNPKFETPNPNSKPQTPNIKAQALNPRL